jgi:hypothetical protein
MPSYGIRAKNRLVWPLWVSLLIGVWLFVSAFVWPHALGERTNTWILGVLIAAVSLLAMSVPRVRFLNTVLAIWLFFATLTIAHHQTGTLWNNLIAAIIVFIMSLLPTRAVPARTPTRGEQRAIQAG